MRKGLLWMMAVGLAATAPLAAQSPSSLPDAKAETKSPAAAALMAPVVDFSCNPACCDTYRFWARGEYLLWWVKNAPLPVPLVTTGDANNGFGAGINTAGAIGQPGTQILLGNESARLGSFSGMRLTLGGWLNNDHIFGIEGSGFLLERRSSRFVAGSDATGNPPLYFPAFNVVVGQERGNPISDPLRGFAGDVSVSSTLELWGAEFNGCIALWRRPGLEVTMLVGFRYMDLKENLSIHNTTTDLLFLNTQVSNDTFDTRNQFYGGQLGVRGAWQRDRLSLDLTGKLALGSTHQIVNIQGDSSQTALPGGFAPTPGSFPGGIFAQPTSSGRFTANQFTVLPALEAKVAYQLTYRLKAFAGYDFMYWNQVVRPGNQIDRNINPSQSTLFGGGALVGQASPAPLFNRTDFWAHGVNVGLEFRY
jgi:Putative beta barrel porin-7 (BBP7)